MGDLNSDQTLNILDIIIMSNMALDTQDPNLTLADLNNDGVINILDIISLVNMILNGRTMDLGENLGTEASISIHNNSLFISSKGNIAGIQMVLKSDHISINDELPFKTNTVESDGNYKLLLYGINGEIIKGEDNLLLTSNSEFEIETIIVSNVLGEAMMVNIKDNIHPNKFELNQNFPNPFNPNTSIQFSLGQNELISLNIYDIQGRIVNSLINNITYSSGYHYISWDGTNDLGTQVPSGVYFYKLIGENQTQIKKMILMK